MTEDTSYLLLRLPGSVKQVFEERIRRMLPLRAERILHRISETRGGKMYDARFVIRGRGQGRYAETIEQLFTSTVQRLGLGGGFGEDSDTPTTFKRPERQAPQLSLF